MSDAVQKTLGPRHSREGGNPGSKMTLKGIKTGFPLTTCGNDELFLLFLLLEMLSKKFILDSYETEQKQTDPIPIPYLSTTPVQCLRYNN